MVERMEAPGGPTALDLSREVNVPNGTLSRWRRDAAGYSEMTRKKGLDKPDKPATDAATGPDKVPRSTREWPPEEKLRVVHAASTLKGEELGELLRREGIHMVQLEEWRADVMAALGSPTPRRASRDPDASRVRQLERELARKDKALAEVTALLVLRKKLDALFGPSAEEGDSTDEDNEKK
jgi:transposase